MSFESKVRPGTQVFGEVAYRPNQPLSLNASDLIGAFLGRAVAPQPLSVLQLAKGVNAIPPGGTFDGYDRFAVTNLSLGGSQVFPNLLGSERVVMVAEVGMSNIDGLPSASKLRYGRSDDYGSALYTGGAATCPATSNALACAQDGFVTATSWGYRLRAAATYAGVMGATVTPSLYFSHDVQGYSYDGTYSEGRRILRPGLRFDWGKKYFAEAQYTMNMGGLYNNLSDRDTFTIAAGLSF